MFTTKYLTLKNLKLKKMCRLHKVANFYEIKSQGIERIREKRDLENKTKKEKLKRRKCDEPLMLIGFSLKS
jgi:hypothetical protein